MPRFRKILIANRGEIACRIARTARAKGYKTVAVYSDADKGALHVGACDQAVRIGPAPVGESYLSIPVIIEAARTSGADAVHPGYGFLSENAGFAEACTKAGLVFIGPPASAIAAMGNKAAAKRRMIEAGVPCVPGYQGADQSDAHLSKEANRIGFPVMVKAAAGGGGRGMRLVQSAGELAGALTGARSEAEQAFGSGELILEKAVVNARHIEIQVFADSHGHTIHLGERDCSVQRRHQKVIEEAPSPAVSTDLRAKMGAAAVKAAASIGYVGAGTVEFLLGADGQFYFLEMNTRLQVEHPVTEAITGLDLVVWQLDVAAGQPLPLTQERVTLCGHAIEVRLYAEDPAQNFLPQSGDVLRWQPPTGAGIRVDHGLKARDTVSPFYDPMIAKIIASGATRDEARQRLIDALEQTHALGIATNRVALIRFLEHPEFAAGRATTAFIPAHFPKGGVGLSTSAANGQDMAVAAIALLGASGERPQSSLADWSSTGAARYPIALEYGGKVTHITATPTGEGRYDVEVAGSVHHVGQADASGGAIVEVQDTTTLHLQTAQANFVFRDALRRPREANAGDANRKMVAPMNGRVVRVLAKAGDAVAKGQCVVVLEAMKMQHEITAGSAGRLASVLVQEGQQVATRALLAELDAPVASA